MNANKNQQHTLQRRKKLTALDKEILQKQLELEQLQLQINKSRRAFNDQERFIKERELELDNAYLVVNHLHRQLELIANESPLAITYTDKFSTYSFANHVFQQWMGKELPAILGWDISLIWDHSIASFINDLSLRASTHKVSEDAFLTFPDGKKRYVVMTVVPEFDNDGELLGHFHFMEDVSHFKNAEEILLNKNNLLEEEIVKREQTENDLKSANEQLKHFAYAIAHDLKSPILAINGFSNILMRKHKDNLNTSVQEMLNFIINSSKNMGQMVNDLLEYATLDKEVTYEDVDLNDTLFIIQHYLKLEMQEKQGQIIYNHLPTIKGNKTLITQLFQNILGNALKFTQKGQPPIINIEYLSHQTHHYITISDNGIGIAAKNLEDIFSVFRRLNKADEYTGSGIGLATCKKIIDIHRGKIWVTSIVGQGTTFHIQLPK